MDALAGFVLQCRTMPAALPQSAPVAAPDAAEAASAGPSFSPLYQQIKGLITRELQAGLWKPGESIPSELDLAARFKVSQGTVRKAIDELAADNLLVRRQGKGTFVATHAEQQIQYRFLRLMPDDGSDRGMARRLLDCRRTRAPADVARMLACKSGDAVVQLRRLLLAQDKPVVLDEIWLPGALFKGLTAERLADYKGPMYGMFEAEFGVRMIRAEEKIRALAADAASAPLLAVAPGFPLLSVERLSFTYGDKPVELRRGLYNTEQHFYRNELN
jgi:GntR family transcriptional regulator